MTATANLIWEQGADLQVQLMYKEGSTPETALPINLSENYAVRMDIVIPSTRERIYTFNSADILDVDPILTGEQPDINKEATLGTGAGGIPNINIVVPRTLTLPGGEVYDKMTANPKILSFNYDIFLRNTQSNKQSKILEGVITVRESYTLWQ